MPSHPTSDFYLSLLRFLLNAKQHFISIGAEHGLSNIQAVALMILDDFSACPMKRISQVFHCDASNITGIIDGLEQKGLVERRSDPKDRRIKTIRLLPAGKRLREAMLSQLARENDFLFAPLEPAEASCLVAIVKKLDPQKNPA